MADRVGETYVNLGLRKSDFDAGLKRAQGGLKDFQRQTLSVGRAIQTGFGAIVGSGVLLGMKSVLDAAAEADKAERMLAAAMREKGGYTEAAMRHNLEYAKSLQALTTYDDEQIMNAQRIFTNYRVEGELLDKLTKATLDLAAAKGVDLESAANLVAKSVGSSTNALSRYGITVEGAVGSTGRLQSAVDGIAERFGGTALAAAQTYEGKVMQLSNSFGEMKESMGSLLMGPAETWVNWLKSATEWLTKYVNKYKEWASINNVAKRDLEGKIRDMKKDLAAYDPGIPGDQAVIARLKKEIAKKEARLKYYDYSPSEPAASTTSGTGKGGAGGAPSGGGSGTGTVRRTTAVSGETQAQRDLALAMNWAAQARDLNYLETYNTDSVITSMTESAIDAYDTIEEESETTAEAMKNAITGWGSHFAATLNDVVWSADVSFKSIAESFGRMITEMLIQKSLVEPLMSSLMGGFDGVFGSLFGGDGGGPHIGAGGTTAFGMASGGVIAEPVFGIGMSGRSYMFGEGGEPEVVIPRSKISSGGSSGDPGAGSVQNNITVSIVAADARSFTEMTMRNPEAIVGPIRKALRSGDRGLISDMRGVI